MSFAPSVARPAFSWTLNKYIYCSTLEQEEYNDGLIEEVIYLKRFANRPLTGRELLYFRTHSSRKGLMRVLYENVLQMHSDVLLNASGCFE